MDTSNPKQQLLERLKTANNILVTVSSNPSVDQLAACIGATLLINKLGKHATAVFSGDVPSTLEFLQPETTLEKTTDSLRDFIISLDKSKADKLRYKVEDKVVKIFITPYRTSLSADDLEYSQGDFNVDVVIALGVKEQQDLDNAITAHGRILHDATLVSINTTENSNLGSLNWQDTTASSLCELVVDLGRGLGKDLLDKQIATALLTGIVAETARFSNEKTTPQTMSISAELMTAGANQQLVASELEVVADSLPLAIKDQGGTAEVGVDNNAKTDQQPANAADGTLEINHPNPDDSPKDLTLPADPGRLEPDSNQTDLPVPKFDQEPVVTNKELASKFVTEPPMLGGRLTANSEPEGYEPSTDPLSLPSITSRPVLSHDNLFTNDAAQAATGSLASTDNVVPAPTDVGRSADFNGNAASTGAESETLAELEQDVSSPHAASGSPDLAAARDEVLNAINSEPAALPPPVQALNAQPIELNTAPGDGDLATANIAFDPAAFGIDHAPAQPTIQPAVDYSSHLGQSMTMPLPPDLPTATMPVEVTANDPNSPPPVPPPIPYQFGVPPSSKPPQL